ncbi:lipopolysaccharide biosynthesis protein [Micromonospora sp. CA-263727]|uniref:lipopolysaccharide biosynthesis protein n=1 Tax=Micromonospora sp. CA-263727 TaxID=3239967 RepID=UPI003D942A40
MTLSDLLRVPLHRIGAVAVVAVLGLVAALGYVTLVPGLYRASAVVAVRPVVTDAFSPSGAAADRAVNMNVESGIATGTEVVRRLAEVNGQDQRDVRDALEVEVPAGGQILRFSYGARSVAQAVRSVNLAAESYLDVRRSMYERQRDEMLRSYDESIAKVVAQQAAIQQRVANARQGGTDTATAELAGINSQLTQLNSARTEIAAVDVNPGWVTRTAEPALVATGGRASMFVLAGLLAGVLLGVLVAYAWESVDPRVRSADDARRTSGLALLGTVRGRRGFAGRRSPVAADVRYVAMAIAERVHQPARVTVLSAREDPTPITARLAVALAVAGREVFVADDSGRLDRLRDAVLVDRDRLPASVDPTRPAVPKPRTAPSSADEITERITAPPRPSPRPFARPSADPDATLALPQLANGPAGPNGAQARGGEVRVGAGCVLLGTFREGAHQPLLLFNAPPAETDERGVAVARQGSAVVVVERDRTRQAELRRLVERLRAAGVTTLGFVLTRDGRG